MSTITNSDGDTTGQGAAFDSSAVAITGGSITGMPTPTAASDVTTKSYVDALIMGLKWKQSVVVATTATGTLATAFANGQTVDGVVLTTGMRILLKNQSTGSENGIYTVNASGAPTRATDADVGSELVAASVTVERGTANADKLFVCTNDTITIGATSIVFAVLPSVVGALIASNNLSDLTSASSARTSLGLGTAALSSISDFDAAGAAAGAQAASQPLDPDLTAIAGLVSAANKVPYFTGSASAALADLSAAGRALIDDADNVAQRATLGLPSFTAGISKFFREDATFTYPQAWPNGSFVCVCIDYDGIVLAGNDTTGKPGIGAPTGVPATDIATAVTAAQLTPFKTFEQVDLVLPKVGHGATLLVMVKGRTAAATYRNKANTADDAPNFVNGLVGYKRVIVRGTTDFSNSASDQITSGFVPVAGTNAGGYNPTAGATISSIPAQLAGGGAAGFPAEATGFSAISGKRIRFDAATATAALRNICVMVWKNDTTTITPSDDLPAVPSTSDVFYIEEPSAVFATINVLANYGLLVFAGVRCTGNIFFQTPGTGASQETPTVCGAEALLVAATAMPYFRTKRSYANELGALVILGYGFRTTSSVNFTDVAGVFIASSYHQGSFTISRGLSGAVGAGCFFRQGAQILGINGYAVTGGTTSTPSFVIGLGIIATARRLRVTQSFGIQVLGGGASVRGLDFANLSTQPLVTLGSSVATNGVTGMNVSLDDIVSPDGGNGNVVLGVDKSVRCNVTWGRIAAITATATAGDISMAGGVIAPAAGLATTNYVDSAGNNIMGAAGHVISETQTYVNQTGSALAALAPVRSNGTTGQMVAAQADSSANASGYLGVCLTSPANGANGLVAYGPCWAAFPSAPTVGALAYLSTATAGQAQSGAPAVAGTNQKLRLGVVSKVSGSNGFVVGSADLLPVTADGNP